MQEEETDKKKKSNISSYVKNNNGYGKPKLKKFIEEKFVEERVKQEKIERERRRSERAPTIQIQTLRQVYNIVHDFTNILQAKNLESLYAFYNMRFKQR